MSTTCSILHFQVSQLCMQHFQNDLRPVIRLPCRVHVLTHPISQSPEKPLLVDGYIGRLQPQSEFQSQIL